MNRNAVIETAYKTIKSNTEWGVECESKAFGYFIDGVISVTETLLERFSEDGRSCESDS